MMHFAQDFGDVVVHVLTGEQREYYNLEKIYQDAEYVDLPFVVEGGQDSGWRRRLDDASPIC